MHVPASINRYLRGYQREGVQFLFRQYAKGEGGILADDMGLGKTVQTIAFLAAVLGGHTGASRDHGTDSDYRPANRTSHDNTAGSGGHVTGHVAGATDLGGQREPCLVIVPTSLLTNWEREFNMWGKFRLRVYRGNTRGSTLAAAAAGNLQVMLASYDTVR